MSREGQIIAFEIRPNLVKVADTGCISRDLSTEFDHVDHRSITRTTLGRDKVEFIRAGQNFSGCFRRFIHKQSRLPKSSFYELMFSGLSPCVILNAD